MFYRSDANDHQKNHQDSPGPFCADTPVAKAETKKRAENFIVYVVVEYYEDDGRRASCCFCEMSADLEQSMTHAVSLEFYKLELS
jgi:hypothetical protein